MSTTPTADHQSLLPFEPARETREDRLRRILAMADGKLPLSTADRWFTEAAEREATRRARATAEATR